MMNPVMAISAMVLTVVLAFSFFVATAVLTIAIVERVPRKARRAASGCREGG